MSGSAGTLRAGWSALGERGSLVPMRAMLLCIRVMPRFVTAPLAHFVALYFALTGRTARRSSLDYLARVARAHPEYGVQPTFAWSYRHFAAFSDAILDKFAAWAGRLRTDDISFENRATYDALIDSGRGALFLGSHLGNLEFCRALCSLDRIVPINALAHTRHAEMFNRLLDETGAGAFRLWQVTELDAATALELRRRIDQGEWVVMTADRLPVHGGRTVAVDFLGSPASFPIGPYVLAGLLECPVYLIFCLRRKGRNHFYVEPFADSIAWQRADRDQVIAGHARRFAARLEHFLAIEPLQWFNFYPFWEEPARAARAVGDVARAGKTDA